MYGTIQKWMSAGADPELLALFEDSIQLLAMADTVRMLIVQEHRRPVVSADLVEGVPSEILIAHNLPVGELVECFPHPVEITLELLFQAV